VRFAAQPINPIIDTAARGKRTNGIEHALEHLCGEPFYDYIRR